MFNGVCRTCKSNRLFMFLDMGLHPPANQFLTLKDLDLHEATFPLKAYACLSCALIQVANHIPADFFRHYVYVPSASTTLQRHFTELAETMTGRFVSNASDLVVDIGSNEGLFLKACSDLGASTLGVEPARNLAEIARGQGLEIVNEYFSPKIAREIGARHGLAKVIVTTNTFNHIDDLHGFMESVRHLLRPDGVFVVEVPQALDLVENNEIDTIYHEHLSQFSVKSLVDLFAFFSMEIFDIDRLEIHGGSMRVYGRVVEGASAVSPAVSKWQKLEADGELFLKSTYEALTERVMRNKARLLAMLHELKGNGKKLAGYGAPAKGNTLLNFFGIGPDVLDFLADKNALKQGLFSPGMHIPVVSPEMILEEQPDYLLILAWNFADEIIEQEEEFRKRGGQFIVPIPEPAIIAPSHA